MPRILTIFVCLFLSTILVFTLVLPKKQVLDLIQKRIEEKRKEIQGKEEYFLNLKQLSQELKNYQIQLSKIDLALPDDPQLPLLFDFLQKAANQAGLVLTSIKATAPAKTAAQKERIPSPGEVSTLPKERPVLSEERPLSPKKEGPEIWETKIDLVLSGSYSAFKNFLSILEKSARLIETESLSFSSPKEETFQFDLKIKIHSY